MQKIIIVALALVAAVSAHTNEIEDGSMEDNFNFYGHGLEFPKGATMKCCFTSMCDSEGKSCGKVANYGDTLCCHSTMPVCCPDLKGCAAHEDECPR